MNIELKVAAIRDGRRQYEIARAAGIEETRLSKVMHGRVQLTEEEKNRLAAVLGRRVDELFEAQ